MERLQGTKIFGGIAIGRICYHVGEARKPKRRTVQDTVSEWEHYENARGEAARQLRTLYGKAVGEVGEEHAGIFEVQGMMLEDDDYNDAVRAMICEEKCDAMYAVSATGERFAAMFAAMEDAYFRARSADVKDISERILRILRGDAGNRELREPCIVVAKDLAPSETVQFDKAKLLAFVTQNGSTNSHTAILARTMSIPALVGVTIRGEWDGRCAVVDGYEGVLIVNPDEPTLKAYRAKQEEDLEKRKLLQELRGKETVTRSGQRVVLGANIGNLSDLEAVQENDADGIGLLRSEFLYLERKDYPTEEEQFAVYRKVAETLAGKQVIIRTLDIGADKQAEYFQLEREENPAMGYRAIRICLSRPDIFRTQLRAILRASAFGRIAVMYPMITSVEEVREIKRIMGEVGKELDAEGVAHAQVQQGVMIETPAAALISDLLAKEVDFFSIGTNDLTQYTLAIDRQNSRLDRFYNAHHEAVLRLIGMVTENAHRAGIWTGICGELGADTELTEAFLKMGVDELSVSPGMILPLRKLIRELP